MSPRLRVLAAGSLRSALTAHAAAAAWGADMVFGPAGLLRQRIEAGDACDLFLSADLAHPRALAAAAPGRTAVAFAGNRIVAACRAGLGATTDTLLDRLLDPAVRIGTSTPGADPGGDYAQALFRAAGRLRPGADAVLAAKAQPLVGAEMPGAGSAAKPPGSFLESGVVDVFICYRTTASGLPAPFVAIEPPRELEVTATYGLVVLAGDPARRAAADAAAASLLSAEGQARLAAHGFEPPA